MKKVFLGVFITNLSFFCFGQQNIGDYIRSNEIDNHSTISVINNCEIVNNKIFASTKFESLLTKDAKMFSINQPEFSCKISNSDFGLHTVNNHKFFQTNNKIEFMKRKNKLDFNYPQNSPKNLLLQNDNFFEKNRRNIYSSMWAFASLNYLYCDLVAFMDKDIHSQYHNGIVDGTNLTPQFLTGAAVMMQIAIANVFLPQVIKNDRTLKWVQFASGITMTLIQSATLFVGKPTPYYATFSAFEIGATTFITINALKWKTNLKKQLPLQ